MLASELALVLWSGLVLVLESGLISSVRVRIDVSVNGSVKERNLYLYQCYDCDRE